MSYSSFVPVCRNTGAPELRPVGAIIEIPEKQLRIYTIDQEQIHMIEEFYGLRNGRKPQQIEYLRLLVSPRKRKPARRRRR